MKEFGLYHYYEDGSNMSLHSRVFGVAPGIIIGKKVAAKGQVRLTYQELDDALTVFLWFCVYLRAHKEIIDRLPQVLPEIDFSQVDIRRYGEMVESSWATLRPLWLQKRGKRLLDIVG